MNIRARPQGRSDGRREPTVALGVARTDLVRRRLGKLSSSALDSLSYVLLPGNRRVLWAAAVESHSVASGKSRSPRTCRSRWSRRSVTPRTKLRALEKAGPSSAPPPEPQALLAKARARHRELVLEHADGAPGERAAIEKQMSNTVASVRALCAQVTERYRACRIGPCRPALVYRFGVQHRAVATGDLRGARDKNWRAHGTLHRPHAAARPLGAAGSAD